MSNWGVLSSPVFTSGSLKRGESQSGLENIFSLEDDISLTELKSEIKTSKSCILVEILLMRMVSVLIF